MRPFRDADAMSIVCELTLIVQCALSVSRQDAH
jgi:hypothetical protein